MLDLADLEGTVDLILFRLAADNAVILGFQFTSDFQNPTGGYVTFNTTDTSTSLGGHVVHVVGYISNAQLATNPPTATVPAAPGGGYFVVKNSYSTCVGDLGFFYLPVSYLTATLNITLVASESH